MNNGAFGENFPYSNFHDLNMDWLIKIAKDFLDQYTNIQNTIDEGLEELNSTYENLNGLLQTWYDTHSDAIANQLADALHDLNEWYSTHRNYLDNILQQNTNEFQARATEIANNVIASIPPDYTEMGDTVREMESVGFIKHTSTRMTTNIPDSAVPSNNHIYFMPLSATSNNVTTLTMNGRFTEDGTLKYDCLAYQVPFKELAHIVTRRAYEYLQVIIDPWDATSEDTFELLYAIIPQNKENEIESLVNRTFVKSGKLERIYAGQGVYTTDRIVKAGTVILVKSLGGITEHVRGVALIGRAGNDIDYLINELPNGEIGRVITNKTYDRIQVTAIPFSQPQGTAEFSFLLGIMDNDYQNDLYNAYKNNYPVNPISVKQQPFTEITLDNVPHSMKEYTISANMTLTQMGKVIIETGVPPVTTYYKVEVTSDKLIITRNDSTIEYNHGLTITNMLNISIHCTKQGKADIILNTVSGTYKAENVTWYACLFFRKYGESSTQTSYIKLSNEDGAYLDATFEFYAHDYDHDVWILGDSYVTMWPVYTVENGYDNYCLDGFSGRASYEALQSFKMGLRFHIPKKVFWCMGMNNSDNFEEQTINQAWLSAYEELRTICTAYNIELILSTIPTTPKVVNGVRTRYHELKNAVIRSSGLRVIDIARAVGALEGRNFVWYGNLLGADETHPTALGSQVIANTVMALLPEIAKD